MKENYSNFLKILIVALFLEVIVFNITSYRTFFGKFEKRVYESEEITYYSEDDDKVFLELDDINSKTATIKLELKDIEDITEYKVFFSDDTSKEYQGLNSKKYIDSYQKSKYIPLYLSGNTRSLLISVDKSIYEDEKIERVIINEKIPFEFNLMRFFIVFFSILLVYFIKNSKILNDEYSNKNLNQEFILLGILAIFFVLLSWINNYSRNPGEGTVYNKDFVDAITSGSFSLLKDPSDKFLELENPYDALTRYDVERDVDYIWDTAFYNGKHYVYFGILPLLISFLPYYLITKKYLEIPVVVFIFSMLIFILFKEILLKILNKFYEKIPFKFVMYFLILLCSGSLILYANGMSRVYELVIVAGVYFVLQGIYFILKSTETEKNRYVNIFFGSLFLALSVACRPTDLIASFLIIPYLLYLLIENIKNVKNSKLPLVKLIVSVAIPYLAVGITLMWYNYVRFGSIFEFGAKYQLTITNMTTLGCRIWAVPTGIITNLFSMPNFILDFPFITNHNNLTIFYGYYYIENMIGGLFILAPICFMNFLIVKANKKIENKSLKVLLNSLVVVSIIIVILSIMMAGSNQRYLIDYAWMIILSGILIFMSIYNSLKTDEAKRILSKVLSIIVVYTFLIGIASGIVSEKSYMQNNSPEEFYKTKYTVCFWE